MIFKGVGHTCFKRKYVTLTKVSRYARDDKGKSKPILMKLYFKRLHEGGKDFLREGVNTQHNINIFRHFSI